MIRARSSNPLIPVASVSESYAPHLESRRTLRDKLLARSGIAGASGRGAVYIWAHVRRLRHYLAILLVWAIGSTAVLATIGVIVAAIRHESYFYWITWILIFGGIGLPLLLLFTAGNSNPTGMEIGSRVILPQELPRSLSGFDLDSYPRTPSHAAMAPAPLLATALGILLRIYF